MGFGAGHMQDMNNRIKQNRAARPSKRSKFKKNNREAIFSKEKASEKFIQKEQISEEELAVLKKQIRAKAKKERKKAFVIYVFFIFMTLAILTWLFLTWA